VARERPVDPMEMLLVTRPRILCAPRFRPSDASFCGFVAAVFVFARRFEISLLMSSCGLDRGGSDVVGAVDTVLVGELILLSERGSDLYDCSRVAGPDVSTSGLFGWVSCSSLTTGSSDSNAVLSSRALLGGLVEDLEI